MTFSRRAWWVWPIHIHFDTVVCSFDRRLNSDRLALCISAMKLMSRIWKNILRISTQTLHRHLIKVTSLFIKMRVTFHASILMKIISKLIKAYAEENEHSHNFLWSCNYKIFWHVLVIALFCIENIRKMNWNKWVSGQTLNGQEIGHQVSMMKGLFLPVLSPP